MADHEPRRLTPGEIARMPDIAQHAPEYTPPMATPVYPAPPRSFPLTIDVISLVVGLLAVAFAAMSWLGQEYGPQTTIAVLVGACALGTYAARRPAMAEYSTRWVPIPVAAIVAAIIWHNYFSYYRTTWQRGSTEYFDVYRTRGPQHIHRRLYISDPATGKVIYTSEGDMAGTPPEPHGLWESFDFADQRIDHQWYWYGEEISQGEWHRRN